MFLTIDSDDGRIEYVGLTDFEVQQGDADEENSEPTVHVHYPSKRGLPDSTKVTGQVTSAISLGALAPVDITENLGHVLSGGEPVTVTLSSAFPQIIASLNELACEEPELITGENSTFEVADRTGLAPVHTAPVHTSDLSSLIKGLD